MKTKELSSDQEISPKKQRFFEFVRYWSYVLAMGDRKDRRMAKILLRNPKKFIPELYEDIVYTKNKWKQAVRKWRMYKEV